MIAWGCITFVPSLYTVHSMYLVKNSPRTNFEFLINGIILIIGLMAIAGNYWTDYQRQLVRETDGKCLIWGEAPALIRAKYHDDKGNEKNSILLASGFWAVARHFNYVFELIVAFTFCAPALFQNIIPYVYFIFLTILLVHRAIRDEDKCSKKYGRYWQQYTKLVPYKMIPGIF